MKALSCVFHETFQRSCSSPRFSCCVEVTCVFSWKMVKKNLQTYACIFTNNASISKIFSVLKSSEEAASDPPSSDGDRQEELFDFPNGVH